MDDEPTQTDARFDRAVLELLHAGEAYPHSVADAPAPPTLPDPTARRIAESAHDARKWSLVARAARTW